MIKGLTPQLAERGKIKIGEKGEMRTSGKGKDFALPRKLDHFVITTMRRDEAGRLVPDKALMEQLAENGKKLTAIPVKLLYDDLDLNFITRYACYRGARCWCSGDGEAAHRLDDKGNFDTVNCPCDRQDPFYTGQDRCKILGTLQMLIQGIDRIGGVWKFRTTSWNSVNAILSSMMEFQAITGGALAGIPLWLVMTPKTVTVPTTGQAMVVFIVSLEFRGDERELADLGYEIAKRRAEHKIRMDHIEEMARKALAHPQLESPEDQRETAEEFYPEAAQEAAQEEAPPTCEGYDQVRESDPGQCAMCGATFQRGSAGDEVCADCHAARGGLTGGPAGDPDGDAKPGDGRAEPPKELAEGAVEVDPEEVGREVEPPPPEAVVCPLPNCGKEHPGPQLVCLECLDKMGAKVQPAKPPRKQTAREAMEAAKKELF